MSLFSPTELLTLIEIETGSIDLFLHVFVVVNTSSSKS